MGSQMCGCTCSATYFKQWNNAKIASGKISNVLLKIRKRQPKNEERENPTCTSKMDSFKIREDNNIKYNGKLGWTSSMQCFISIFHNLLWHQFNELILFPSLFVCIYYVCRWIHLWALEQRESLRIEKCQYCSIHHQASFTFSSNAWTDDNNEYRE